MSPRRIDVNELLLLGLLARGGRHGYELHDFLGNQLAFVSDLSRPTAYRILNRLHEKGLLMRESEREGSRPERTRYTLTSSGRARMLELLRATLERDEYAMDPINIPLLFLPELPSQEVLVLLEKRQRAMTARYESLARGLEAHPPDNHERLVLERIVELLKTELRWMDRARSWLAQHGTG